ncbi:Pseudouridine synthase [Mycobacterium tuberculosis CAS/NITR204]|uniref:Pseudouridine synthase n=1 Tax=Mycobacterium tuberculosis CAS/NITR204 TaxID=1310114 RepID=R4MIK8_MYCTX|nr:Pseudouridine synthase [Mycobacterium tuberculosis CAS/NITR204]
MVDSGTVLPPGSVVHLYRDLPDEVPVPFDVPVLHQDADIVVVDKPHFLATSLGANVRRPRWCSCAANWDCPS